MRILHLGFGFRPWRHGGLIVYAEDVMEAQAARGDHVAYFFRGRHYPGLADDRVRSWSRRGVLMREILNSSLVFGGDSGTLTPEADLHHAPSERHFARVLDEVRPDVVHIQEVMGLPTSVIDIAHGRGIPVVATMQDYFPLCPIRQLYDVDHQICLRHDVGEQCARCSAWAPDHRRNFRYMTAEHDLGRVLGRQAAAGAMSGLKSARRLFRSAQQPPTATSPAERGSEPPRERTPPAAAYQARRDANLERLSSLDALVAASSRVAEIYARLGVDERRIRVINLTVRHLESLTPTEISRRPDPIRFVTLNGASSPQKGASVLVDALSHLSARGLTAGFRLTVLGWTPEATQARLRDLPGVDLVGQYQGGELDRILNGFDVGIMPSIWEDPYPFTGLELLAKGIPVIGNARGGIVDYVRDGQTGWLNSDAGPAGLAGIMEDIIRRPEQITDRSHWILEHRDDLIKSLDRHIDELEQLYDSVRNHAAVG